MFRTGPLRARDGGRCPVYCFFKGNLKMFNRTRVRRLLAAFLFAVLAQGSWAATITVTSSGDVSAFDGACTLREAITVIMGSGPSTFDCPNVGFAFGTNDQVIFRAYP